MTDAQALRPVVVGVDGTADSLRAVTVAARQAVARGTSLRIVHANLWPAHKAPAEAGTPGPGRGSRGPRRGGGPGTRDGAGDRRVDPHRRR